LFKVPPDKNSKILETGVRIENSIGLGFTPHEPTRLFFFFLVDPKKEFFSFIVSFVFFFFCFVFFSFFFFFVFFLFFSFVFFFFFFFYLF